MKYGCLLLSLFWPLSFLQGTPSSVFWTVCTPNIYAPGTFHIDQDFYFSMRPARSPSSFPPDTGLEFGICQIGPWHVEGGIDYLSGAQYPCVFNAGIGAQENSLFDNSPAIKLGIFNVGTRCHGKNATNQNIVDLILGTSLPKSMGGGTLCIGGFSGSSAMGKDRQGGMISYQQYFSPAVYKGRTYSRWAFLADYASGKNTIGGGSVAIGYYFTPDIDILTGPVWFNSKKINGSWKWSVQLDINIHHHR